MQRSFLKFAAAICALALIVVLMVWFLNPYGIQELPPDKAAAWLQDRLRQGFNVNLALTERGVVSNAAMNIVSQDGQDDWYFEIHPSSAQHKEILEKIGAPPDYGKLQSRYVPPSHRPDWFAGDWRSGQLRVWNPAPADSQLRYHFVFGPSAEIIYIHIER